MNMKGLGLLCALLAGCASAPRNAAAPQNDASRIEPARAVQLAAAAAPLAVSGVFAVHVQASGSQHGVTYLNSERDYRDQRNLSVAIAPNVAEQLEMRYGKPPGEFFKDKDILVTGAARRVTIWFFSGGARTDKYYYQTHVRVTDLDQIRLATRG